MARRLATVNCAELVIDHVSGFVRDCAHRRMYALDRFHISARKATPAERMEPFERYRRGLAKLLARRRLFEKRRYIEQEGNDFDPRLLRFRFNGTVYLDGLWQSEKYFKDVEDLVRQDLRIRPPQDDENLAMAETIRSCKGICVHVRFFDSPDADGCAETYNVGKHYYARARAEITSQLDNLHFFIFSDNPDVARRQLRLPESIATSVSQNRGDETAYADLWLMTQCKHFIISNSTFSWWAAWLAENKDKIVIAPDIKLGGITAWGFKGLIPEGWISL